MITIQTPASRTTDPETSHEAEQFINDTGIRSGQQKKVLLMLDRHQGSTSAEIAKKENADRAMIARRLPELEPIYIFKGRARKCEASASNRKAHSWYLTEYGRTTVRKLLEENKNDN